MSTKSYEYEDLWVMSTKTYECEESHRYLQLLCHTRLWGGAVAICVATGARSVVADGGARLFVICNLWNETGGKDRTCLDSCVLFVYKTEAWSCGWWCPFVCHQQFVKWNRGKDRTCLESCVLFVHKLKLQLVVPVCLSSAVCEMKKTEGTEHVWKFVFCSCNPEQMAASVCLPFVVRGALERQSAESVSKVVLHPATGSVWPCECKGRCS